MQENRISTIINEDEKCKKGEDFSDTSKECYTVDVCLGKKRMVGKLGL